jgi:DNA topoisomerase IB
MDFTDKISRQTYISPNFSAVLDDACNRLRSKKAELSIRRIRFLEEELTKMEKELDDFIARKP